MRSNERALAIDARDPDARVFRAVLLAFIDQVPQAWAEIDAVIAEKPDHARALVYRGLLSLRLDPAKAVEVLEKANALDPSPQVQAILAEARRRLAAPPGGAQAPAASGTELLAEGRLTLANPAATGQKVFVSLRDPAGGPPLAALVLDPGPFPMDFRVTGANRVAMGGARPMPAVVLVTARLDSDGDALTRPATDPSASREISVGATGLDLVLGAAP
jgi:cytochrome c-type biogenesis protein CcmH